MCFCPRMEEWYPAKNPCYIYKEAKLWDCYETSRSGLWSTRHDVFTNQFLQRRSGWYMLIWYPAMDVWIKLADFQALQTIISNPRLRPFFNRTCEMMPLKNTQGLWRSVLADCRFRFHLFPQLWESAPNSERLSDSDHRSLKFIVLRFSNLFIFWGDTPNTLR